MGCMHGIFFNHEGPTRGEPFVTRKITRAVAAIELGLQAEGWKMLYGSGIVIFWKAAIIWAFLLLKN